MTILTDNNPEETTWYLHAGSTTYASGGPYPNQPNTLITHSIDLPSAGFFTLVIFDSFGDGICCNRGQGYYRDNPFGGVPVGQKCERYNPHA